MIMNLNQSVSVSKHQRVPLWISAKGKIDINSTDHVSQVLNQIWKRLDKYSVTFSECEMQIYFNTVSLADRKPIVVGIGPNHRDTSEPDVMEVHKLKYLKDFVERTNSNVEELVRANLVSFVDLAIEYLNDHNNNWGSKGLEGFINEFIEMYILDGCFIIELFLKKEIPMEKVDPLFKSEWVMWALSQDLILLDNQLPFGVLSELCKHCDQLSMISDQVALDGLKFITELALKFLERIVPNQKLNHTSLNLEHKKTDLVGLMYDRLNWPAMSPENYYNSNIDGDNKWNMVKSATELKEFGVQFKMIETDNFTDIKFTNKGVLEIPRIRIRYGTPYSIKVLLAYEQSHRQHKYLNNYLWFMNNLVKSPSDVQLLRQKEIIDNLSELPDDAAIYKFLKDLYASLMVSPVDFNYVKVCRELNSHCKHRRYRWMAKLKRDYFNSPWAVISFFAASLLLILTTAQTVFSIASYYKRGYS